MSKSAILIRNKIEISFPYDQDTITLVKKLPDRKWHGDEGVWKVPATAWNARMIMSELPDFYVDDEIRQLARSVSESTEKITLPKEIKKLYRYQKVGVQFIAKARGNCIVADDMGLGKTAEALVYLSAASRKALIVAPSNVTYKWRDAECPVWSPNKSVFLAKDSKCKLEDAEILIMSYDIMVLRYEELKEIEFDLAIFDEAHYLKSPKSQRGRIAKALVKNIRRKLFLSGTPFMNRPAEMFPLLNMLDPIAFSNFYSYATRYCGATLDQGFLNMPRNGVSNADELAKRLEDFMIRRTKKEVALELPSISRSFVPVPMSNMKEYKEASKRFRDGVTKDKKKSTALTQLTELRQVVGLAKVSSAIELAENVLDAERQVVLFAHHKAVVSLLETHFKSMGVGVISGDTPAQRRQELTRIFNLDNSKLRVMIITTAGSEGINLFGASDIIFVEREWTPAKEEQTEARLHRIGQKNPVTSYYLVASGTIDEHMNKLVEEKRSIFNQVIGQDEILTEIMNLLVKEIK